MGRCTKEDANERLELYRKETEAAIEEIQKDYQDMDMWNASLRVEIEEILSDMRKNLQLLLGEI